MGRPSEWKDGKCKRGHDITLPDALYIYGTTKVCKICRKQSADAAYAKYHEKYKLAKALK